MSHMLQNKKITPRVMEILDELNNDLAKKVYIYLLEDQEIRIHHERTNYCAIHRFKFNDHGRIHAKIVILNSLKLFSLLKDKVEMDLITEGACTMEDIPVVIMTAAFLHDLGNMIHRTGHYAHSLIIAQPIIERVLKEFYPLDFAKQIKLKTAIMECIYGHDESVKNHSIESSIVSVADGLDAAQGRAREVYIEEDNFSIHALSAMAIKDIKVGPSDNDKKHVKCVIVCSYLTAVFQVTEILIKKINSTMLKPFIEIKVELLPEYNNGKYFEKYVDL